MVWSRRSKSLILELVLQKGEASIRAGLSEQSNFEIILLKAAEESRSLEIDSLIETIVASKKGGEKKKHG